jgi:hypothetical protein
VAIIATASALVFTVADGWPDRTPISSPAAPSTSPATASGVEGCDRYSIDAKTLGLRAPDGDLTGEALTRGTAVTVLRRSGPAGRRYWYVTSDDGRKAGWILPSARWWHTTC